MTQPDGIVDAAGLIAFHTRYKLLLMAHSPAALQHLGRLVATAGERTLDQVSAEYSALFRDTLAQPATRGGHVNALQHMVGYLRRLLTDTERRGIADAIESFGNGSAPLFRPLSIIREHVVRHRVPYLLDQVYLDPARPTEREP